MNRDKYLKHLEDQFEKSFTFSKEVARKRDNKLIEGFIYKAEEEISFNDFYSSGNENILKYSGIIFGLEEKNYPFFKELPMNIAWKLHDIEKVTADLLSDNDDNQYVFNLYKLGAEHCLYNFVDENFKFDRLSSKLKFHNILNKLYELGNESVNSLAFNKLIKEGEFIIDQTKQVDKKLESITFLKKNAYYAAKQFYWMHEKGMFDNMSKYELKLFYSKQVKEEIKYKTQLLQSDFKSNEYIVSSDLAI